MEDFHHVRASHVRIKLHSLYQLPSFSTTVNCRLVILLRNSVKANVENILARRAESQTADGPLAYSKRIKVSLLLRLVRRHSFSQHSFLVPLFHAPQQSAANFVASEIAPCCVERPKIRPSALHNRGVEVRDENVGLEPFSLCCVSPRATLKSRELEVNKSKACFP